MTQELRDELKEVFLKSVGKEEENQGLGFDYDVIMLKLRECALHQPGIDLEKDEEVLALESQLLSLEEDILERTVKVKITNHEDFKVVKKLWQSAAGVKQNDDICLLDQLALTLFKYTEQRT